MTWLPLTLPPCDSMARPQCLIVYGTGFPVSAGPIENICTAEEMKLFTTVKFRGNNSIRPACRATLRILLGWYLGKAPQSIPIRVGRNGCLSIDGGAPFFNVSYTATSFVVAISRRHRVGIDMERLSGDEDLGEIAGYAFSAGEIREWKGGRDFTEIWTRKEAVLKAAGLGLTNVPDLLDSQTLLKKWGLLHHTLKCPGNEIASIVTREDIICCIHTV